MKKYNIKPNIDNYGFCKVEKIFSSNGIDECESIITSFMHNKGLTLLKSEMSENPKQLKNQQIELKRPSMLSSKLRKSEVFNCCRAIAEEYFDGAAYYLFDHAIYKMPGCSTVTPWHQDQAYLDPEIIIPSLHFWIPFQNTNAQNGAMQFVVSSHHELLPHKLAYSNNSHVLKVEKDPVVNIFTMDMYRGDVSIHTNFTLHSTTANSAFNTRKAWIIHFGQKPEWYKHWLKLKARTTKAIKKIT